MKIQASIQYILIFTALIFLHTSCFDFNNPVDPDSDAYQGYPTHNDPDLFAGVEVPNASGTIWIPLQLMCTEIIGARGYSLALDDNEDLSSPVLSVSEQESNIFDVTSAGLTDGEWHYGFTLYETDGNTVDSVVLSFTLIEAEYRGFSPVDGGTATDTTPLLSWTVVSGAESYELQIADSKTGVNSAAVQDCTSNQYQVAESLNSDDIRYWRIRALNGDGIAASTSWSEIVSFKGPYGIGETGPAGGIIFYVDTVDTYPGWDYLEAAPNSWNGGALNPEYEWGGYGYSVGGTLQEIGSGAANTAAIVAAYGAIEPYNGLSNYAARVCDQLNFGGYDDWFLPSWGELYLMYDNLYSSGLGGFTSFAYWSSSEVDSGDAWLQGFGSGSPGSDSKYVYQVVRPVRAF
ncbi:MAG: DUF1566 domain-containing protein [Spirochaetales bacterium]|nr:DUF1566 domain-containing protein [Spirochaetales bacterium]